MGLSAILAVFATSDEQAMSRVQNQDDHRAFAQLIERWEKPILPVLTYFSNMNQP